MAKQTAFRMNQNFVTTNNGPPEEVAMRRLSNASKTKGRGKSNLPPPCLLSHQSSQDVFFVHTPDGRVELAKSRHVGHQFFKSLTELHRTKFLDGVKNDPEGPMPVRISLTILNSIRDRGRGKMFVQPLNSEEWLEVTDQAEARDCIYRALLSTFGLEDKSESKALEIRGKRALPKDSQRVPTSQDAFPQKKRARFNTEQAGLPAKTPRDSEKSIDAAETLALMLGNPSQTVPTAQSLPFPRNPRPMDAFNPLSLSPSPGFLGGKLTRPLPDNLVDLLSKTSSQGGAFDLPASQSHTPSMRMPQVPSTRSEGISTTAIRPTDVLVGGDGVGALDTKNMGNGNFRSMVETKIDKFALMDKQDKLRMCQATARVVHESSPPGRFLSLNSMTGLLDEIPLEQAWTKTMQTYQDSLQRYQQNASLMRLNEAIKQQEMLEKMPVFGSLKNLYQPGKQQVPMNNDSGNDFCFSSPRVRSFMDQLRNHNNM